MPRESNQPKKAKITRAGKTISKNRGRDGSSVTKASRVRVGGKVVNDPPKKTTKTKAKSSVGKTTKKTTKKATNKTASNKSGTSRLKKPSPITTTSLERADKGLGSGPPTRKGARKKKVYSGRGKGPATKTKIYSGRGKTAGGKVVKPAKKRTALQKSFSKAKKTVGIRLGKKVNKTKSSGRR